MLLLCQAVCKGEWTDPTDSLSSLPAATLTTWDRNCPCLAQGKGLLTAAPCHTDNVTSCARQAGALGPAGRTDL